MYVAIQQGYRHINLHSDDEKFKCLNIRTDTVAVLLYEDVTNVVALTSICSVLHYSCKLFLSRLETELKKKVLPQTIMDVVPIICSRLNNPSILFFFCPNLVLQCKFNLKKMYLLASDPRRSCISYGSCLTFCPFWSVLSTSTWSTIIPLKYK